MGDYDIILTFADHDAVGFFAKCGFNDDPILNSPFRPYLDDDWDQSILMSYHRPVAAEQGGRGWSVGDRCRDEASRVQSCRLLGQDIQNWREMRVREYGAQLGLIERMQNEITALQSLVVAQESHLTALKKNCLSFRQELSAEQHKHTHKPLMMPCLPCRYRHSDEGISWVCFSDTSAEFSEVQQMLVNGSSGDLYSEADFLPHSAGSHYGSIRLLKLCASCRRPCTAADSDW